jgi:cyclase
MNRRIVLKTLPLLISPVLSFDPFKRDGKRVDSSHERKGIVIEKGNISEIAPNIFFSKGNISYFQNGNINEVACNNGWIIFEDFVVLIDSNFPAQAPLLLDEIRKTTSKPIKFVFNTHHHGDHLYGNRFWAEKGATIISYKGVVEELKKYEKGYYSNVPGRWEEIAQKRNDLKAFPLFPPNSTFTEQFALEDKNTRLEFLHLGAGHTLGDGVAWLPNEKVLFTGDSCLTGPYNLLRDANVGLWLTTLDKMDQLKPAILIPGHGEPGNSETVKKQKAYLEIVYEWVIKHKKTGLSLDSVKMKQAELRKLIEKDEVAKNYLIHEPAAIPAFSLEAHVTRIYQEIV